MIFSIATDKSLDKIQHSFILKLVNKLGQKMQQVEWYSLYLQCIHSPEFVNVTLFGKSVFADIIQLRIQRCDHPGLPKWALNPMTRALVRDRKDTETQGRSPCEDKSRDWNDIATRKGFSDSSKAGGGNKGLSSRDFGGSMVLWL